MFLISLLFISTLVCCVQMNNGKKSKNHKYNRDFVGIYDYSFDGESFYRMHICEDKETQSIYWGCAFVEEDGRERTVAVGRDSDGAEKLSKSETQISCTMFGLFAAAFGTVGTGTYSITYDSRAKEYTMVMNFPDQGIVEATVTLNKQTNGRKGRSLLSRPSSSSSSSSSKHKHHALGSGNKNTNKNRADDNEFAMTEERRCFIPYASAFGAEDFPLATVQVDEDTLYTVGDKGDRLSTYSEETRGVECFEDNHGPGTTELVSEEWEDRLTLFKFTADDQDGGVCANGYVMQVRVAEDLIMSTMECEDAAGIGVTELVLVDHSDASWHQCPIGN